MKKVILAAGAVILCLASCTTTTKTAGSIDVSNSLTSESFTDLEVQNQRITYTLRPSKSIRRGGMRNVKAAAVAEALKANGDGDVLVEPRYETKVRTGIFGNRKIKSVTVSGYPAKYKNFRISNK